MKISSRLCCKRGLICSHWSRSGVLASTGRLRKILLKEARADRELPALGQLISKPALGAIRAAVESLFADDRALARRIGMFLCRCHTGRKLKEICVAYTVSVSAVTQASRRVAVEMKRSESVHEAIVKLEMELGVSQV